jgi:hypothetical protein
VKTEKYPSFETRITRIAAAAADDSSNTKTGERRSKWVPSHIRFGGFAVSTILVLIKSSSCNPN